MSPELQELLTKYSNDPESAEEIVKNHEWTRSDIKLLRKTLKYGGWGLPKEAKNKIKEIINLAEERLNQHEKD